MDHTQLLKDPHLNWEGGGLPVTVPVVLSQHIFQAACVSQYEHKDLAEFLEGLWVSLRGEVC